MTCLAVVGKRAGALSAAARLGLDVLLLVEQAPRRRPRGVRAVFERSFDADFGAATFLAGLAEHGPCAGVLATTERAVLAAAQLRAALGLPGVSPDCARTCTDKLLMKRRVRASGIACADFLSADDGCTSSEIAGRLGLPIWLKPRRGSGGRGAQRVDTQIGLPAHIAPGQILEGCVRGIEMSVESLVQAGRPIFVNCTEYFEPRWANLLPAELPPDALQAVLELNQRALAALGVERGITHLELFRTSGGVVFGELAARPPGGHLMELIELAYGFDPWVACIELELGRVPRVHTRATRHAGVRVLHPGAGTIARITGLEALAGRPELVRADCRVAPGDTVAVRRGAGQEVGSVVFAAPERAAVAAALELAARTVRFELAP